MIESGEHGVVAAAGTRLSVRYLLGIASILKKPYRESEVTS